ncbi:hypothetical protein [Halovulum sp. GXIMD14793]
MTQSNRIATMWFEGPLHDVARVCLTSMLANDMDVTVFTFGDVPNLPDDIRQRDGRDILDPALLDRLQPIRMQAHRGTWLPVVQFSDIFRILQMKTSEGLWLDTDIFLFRPFTYDTEKTFYAHEGGGRLGYSVLHLPQDHPIIGEYEKLIEIPDLMPNWLGPMRGWLKPFWWRMTRQAFSPQDLGITIYGNDGFSRLARRHGCFDEALPKDSFYAWTARQAEDLFRDVSFAELRDDPAHYGIHIHKKAGQNRPPVPGSFWEWALETYG